MQVVGESLLNQPVFAVDVGDHRVLLLHMFIAQDPVFIRGTSIETLLLPRGYMELNTLLSKKLGSY
jgi:hypothetical protein